MDVEQRSGQLYNSELSASFIGLPVSSNRHMNQFNSSQKSKVQELRKPNKTIIRSTGRTPTLDVLPKIDQTKSTSPETMTAIINTKSQSSNNNASFINDKFPIDLPDAETFATNNVQEWLQMPSKIDQQHSSLTAVSSESEDMLTRVGEFTDRTSVTSSEWGDDVCEFDKRESHRVNQMFEEIEWMLFNDGQSSLRSGPTRTSQSSSFSDRNGISSGPAHLKRECIEWRHQFPHFRIIGQQVSLPLEQGYMFHECNGSGNVTPKNSPRILITNSPVDSDFNTVKSNGDGSDIEKISLVGYSIQLETVDTVSSSDEVDLFSSQEEVFAADGEIVEIIAIDYKMDDEDFNIVTRKKSRSHNSLLRSHKGYPPITPNAVMRDAVLTAVFDNLWSQVVDWILPLLSKMYQIYSSRESSELNQPMLCDLYRNPKPQSHTNATTCNNLDNLLKISSKTLQFREKSYLQSIPEQAQNSASNIRGAITASFAPARHSLALMNNSRKPNKMISTLDRSHTPLSNHESSFILDREHKRSSLSNQTNFISSSEHLSPLRCVRGKALYNCQSPDMLSRCGTLPPINNRFHTSTQLRSTSSRIGSAQMQSNQNLSMAGGSVAHHILLTSEFANTTRPCTSQTARSDVAGGHRSSTPSGNRRSLNLNVHGSSIAMNFNSAKANDELSYSNFKSNNKSKPFWKIYNNSMPVATSKRNKPLSNYVK